MPTSHPPGVVSALERGQGLSQGGALLFAKGTRPKAAEDIGASAMCAEELKADMQAIMGMKDAYKQLLKRFEKVLGSLRSAISNKDKQDESRRKKQVAESEKEAQKKRILEEKKAETTEVFNYFIGQIESENEKTK